MQDVDSKNGPLMPGGRQKTAALKTGVGPGLGAVQPSQTFWRPLLLGTGGAQRSNWLRPCPTGLVRHFHGLGRFIRPYGLP